MCWEEGNGLAGRGRRKHNQERNDGKRRTVDLIVQNLVVIAFDLSVGARFPKGVPVGCEEMTAGEDSIGQ